jgi:hypothetical protein
MSWDVVVLKIRGRCPPSPEELQDNDCLPLGSARDVRKWISTRLSGVDWSDPTCGLYEHDGLWIEFDVGNDDPINSMMLRVRGSGDAISAIMAVTSPKRWSALDCSTSDFLNPENPSPAGWLGFQALREKAVGMLRDGGDESSRKTRKSKRQGPASRQKR